MTVGTKMDGSMSTVVVLCAIVVVLACVPLGVNADLPVHCLNVQVSGEWVFELGENKFERGLRCGHRIPDTNADHFTKEGFNLEVVRKISINLTEPNIAIDEHGNRGTWTMVYDEGFEVIINNMHFFAFNKYVPKTPESLLKDDEEDYISICDETLVGWFHDSDGTHWGCYHAQKLESSKPGALSNMPTGRKNPSYLHNDHILSPGAMKGKPNENSRGEGNDDDDDDDDNDDNGFAQVEDPLFEPDISFIELHNSNPSNTWTAGVHKPFLGHRLSQMMKLIGYQPRKSQAFRSAASSSSSSSSDPFELLQLQSNRVKNKHIVTSNHNHRHRKRRPTGAASPGDYGDLPKHFDWRNFKGFNWDSPIRNQGNCGSCYAMATASVVEARLRILTNMRYKPTISSQAVVSCSIYNQGCDGGYPYLVAKHGQDFGFVLEDCMPYSGTNEECILVRGETCPDPHNPIRVFAKNYTYIGGYYGACNEIAMMREIYEHGPIMVAFDAPSSLFYYTGGVYTGPAAPHEGPSLPNLHPWEKTNHAVVAVGWGETDDGVKYWIIKNTWGQSWGENGYFRMRRGTDECASESMASTVYIDVPKEWH